MDLGSLTSLFPQLWQELCELLSQHPDRVRSLDAGGIIRGGLTRFTDQRGRLWGALADCYVRCGHLEKVTLLSPGGTPGEWAGTHGRDWHPWEGLTPTGQTDTHGRD